MRCGGARGGETVTDGEFATKARSAAKVAGGTDVQVTANPTLIGVSMEWRGKRYEVSMTRTGDAELDDRAKALILDAVGRHGRRERDTP